MSPAGIATPNLSQVGRPPSQPRMGGGNPRAGWMWGKHESLGLPPRVSLHQNHDSGDHSCCPGDREKHLGGY